MQGGGLRGAARGSVHASGAHPAGMASTLTPHPHPPNCTANNSNNNTQ